MEINIFVGETMNNGKIIDMGKIAKLKEIEKFINKTNLSENELTRLAEILSDDEIEKIVKERYGL